ncbi:hypothetical protein QMK19_20150 [Streptomyces sp. H10-C2]|uniref:hypothetical protein n=1 Tax=unclassified Streptomyces TaxID=2593676 RepID=UPI0024BB2517|nr:MULTISPECIES: hypothetical protein [unclassified Streptomyces]MDJ0344867.1 hypothetical protein [Streptomyces sp. PH10-H1]MDJ0371927.1 hypothetical protein [Streptomyces sp. H10-C2]
MQAYNRSSRHAAGRPVRGVQTRLPWWAVALPAVAFAALLMLIAGPGRTNTSAAAPAGHLIARIADALPGIAQHIL